MNFKIALALKQAKNTKNASGYGDERICAPVGITYLCHYVVYFWFA